MQYIGGLHLHLCVHPASWQSLWWWKWMMLMFTISLDRGKSLTRCVCISSSHLKRGHSWWILPLNPTGQGSEFDRACRISWGRISRKEGRIHIFHFIVSNLCLKLLTTQENCSEVLSLRYCSAWSKLAVLTYIFFLVQHQVAEVWVQRASELGSDNMIFCRTHLGNLLSPGCTVLGYISLVLYQYCMLYMW